ncbi:alpha/beta fold hydrolase [Streptomyces sp. NPDC058746]|uniref:alpha/beta fold hydrolase n=1 Tax=Streptomyces sp. NPDC058746 TaxID=3346622 RepID=UPI00368B80D3
MVTTASAFVSVPGTELYYEKTGTGPLLFLMDGGGGDARRTGALVERLADRYTVVTYDRRGMSRSALGDPAPELGPQVHTQDLALLMEALADGPSLLFGHSVGGVIGLHLTASRPDLVSVYAAHEPSELALLTGADREAAAGLIAAAEADYRTAGWGPALAHMARFNDIDLAGQDAEPDVVPAPMTAEQLANIEFFLAHEIGSYRHHLLADADLDALKSGPARIVPLAGRPSDSSWSYRCARSLADRLGTPLEAFPGGHNGLKTHPTAFANRLHEALAAT